MKRAAILFLSALLMAACSKHPELAAPIVPDEPEPVAVTNWTKATELFMEYPPLVAGVKSRAAVHFTDLHKFAPLTAGVVSIDLVQNGRSVQSFNSRGPSRPGIFGVDLEPSQPGKYMLSVSLSAPGLTDEHKLGEVTVHARAEDSSSPPGQAAEETIPFLKEQQWTLDFATQLAATRDIRESLLVTGEIRPRTGGDVAVIAPIDGRIILSSAALPIGAAVAAGQELARIAPRTPEPANLPDLQLEIEEAKSHLDHTRRDLARAERLVSAGAAPERRLHEAQEDERLMAARLKAAEAKLALYQENRRGDSTANPASLFTVQSPIAGVIAGAEAISGRNTTSGEPLFRVVAMDLVHLIVSIPEADAWRAASITGAEIALPGTTGTLPVRRLIADSRVIDPETRTLSLIYEVENAGRKLAIGQSLAVRVFFTRVSNAVAVPEGAIVDDGGRPVVFVQLEGEAFARRPVTLGSRSSGYVQVVSGVKEGERVVSRGAYLIRLAALSPTIPAHGHVH